LTEAQIEPQTKDKGTQCKLLNAPTLDKFSTSTTGLDDSFLTEPDQEDTDYCYNQEKILQQSKSISLTEQLPPQDEIKYLVFSLSITCRSRNEICQGKAVQHNTALCPLWLSIPIEKLAFY